VYNNFVMKSNRSGDDRVRMAVDRAAVLELAAAVLAEG
jgi:hypothetical protein